MEGTPEPQPLRHKKEGILKLQDVQIIILKETAINNLNECTSAKQFIFNCYSLAIFTILKKKISK